MADAAVRRTRARAATLAAALVALASASGPAAADGPAEPIAPVLTVALAPAAIAEVPTLEAAPMRAAGPAASDASTLPWSERHGLLESLRWWMAPGTVDALRDVDPASFDARVEWTAPSGHDGEATAGERRTLVEAKLDALVGRTADADAPGVPHDTVSSHTDSRWRMTARVVEVWRPNRLINAVLVAMPWPMTPFFSQGGAATELELVDAYRDTAVARFECRRHAGILQFYNAFWRVAHSRSALSECARLFIATLRDGRPPSFAAASAVPPPPGYGD